MGATGTLLVGIACVLAQGSPEAEKLKSNLTQDEVKLVEQLQQGQVCQQLDEYIQQGKDPSKFAPMVMGCQSCLKTYAGLTKEKQKEK